MMAVKAPIPFSLNPTGSSNSFAPNSSYPVTSRLPGMASPGSNMSATAQTDQMLKSSSTRQAVPHEPQVKSQAAILEKSPNIIEHVEVHAQPVSIEPHKHNDTKGALASPAKSGPLKIDIEKSFFYNPSATRDDEPPISVIHAPVGFGKFSRAQSVRSMSIDGSGDPTSNTSPQKMGSTPASTASSESAASDATVVTVTKLTGENVETTERPTQIPPLQTKLPIAPEWTKTPRAQTRKDLGVLSRPGSSLASLASISEAEDDHPDHPTDGSVHGSEIVEDEPLFYRTGEEEIRVLQTALTECWTLCNTLSGLSYVHREKMFLRRGNMQQQAWRSCWKLCQNLYETRDNSIPMNVRLTLDLCREFCQALFDVRARGDEPADSVLRVSFELNNHLFNTHDRNLPEAFAERTLDFYITLCHRLMKQRSTIVEETGSLLRACWSLAEMLFSIRQARRDGRRPDEELLSSAIQACWELCDLFRDGWTQVRPERQTPRPSLMTLTQAFQKARQASSSTTEGGQQLKVHPETPTTIFEDLVAESPYEINAPNIVVLHPGEETSAPKSATSTTSSQPPSTTSPVAQLQTQPRQSTYRWPSANSASSVTTLSTNGGSSHESSIRTVRSPSDDPNMALLKSLFVRAAMHTNRGFTPLASSHLNTPATSLPQFVKSLPEIAFGSQAWQMSLLDNYRKAVANDPTFHTLGIAANPTLLGMEGDETTEAKIRVDTAKAITFFINSTFGWTWLKELYRFAFGRYLEDVLSDDNK